MSRGIILPPNLQAQTPNWRYNSRLQGLSSSIEPVPADVLSPDLRPIRTQEYGIGGEGQLAPKSELEFYVQRAALGIEQLASTVVVSRGLVGQSFNIGTTATRVVRSDRLKGYLFLNPITAVSSVLSGQINVGTVTGSGNTLESGFDGAIDVSLYRDLHVFVNVTDTDSGTTTLTLNLLTGFPISTPTSSTFNPISQVLLTTATVGYHYVNAGSVGMGTNIGFSWSVSGGSPTATFSIEYVLKDGLPGSTSSALGTIYLGPGGVTTVSGFPILSGRQQAFYIRENIDIYAIGGTSGLSLRVFEL